MNVKLKGYHALTAGLACASALFAFDGGRPDTSPMRMGRRSVMTDTRSGGGFSNKGAWSPTETYRGDYTIFQGDTVSHGTFNGQKLWWWAKFYAQGENLEPGNFAPEGGTSPWVLINSQSAVETGTVNYTWRGWNNDMERELTGLKALLPTWRDGAQGAYTMNHDDIGPINFDMGIRPVWELRQEFPDITHSWGVFVGAMKPQDWEYAREMVAEWGIEMFCHSYDHTSAADQWQWFRPGQIVPSHDPSIPVEIRGLKVVGTWGDPSAEPTYPVPGDGTKVFESPLVAIRATHYWTQNAPTSELPGRVLEGVGEVIVPQIFPKEGVEEITLPTGQKQYVKYYSEAEAASKGYRGYIAATGPTWYEATELNQFGGQYWKPSTPALLTEPPLWDGSKMWWGAGVGTLYSFNGSYWQALKDAPGEDPTEGSPGWKHLGNISIPYFSNEGEYVGPKWSSSTPNVSNDQGAPGFVAKVWCVEAWTPEKYKINIRDAADSMDKYIYEPIKTSGEHFRPGMRTAFYGYPFDAYSEVTHDSLERYGYTGARGGAKSGVPTPGDFFHPYRIDFDAFYITRPDWTPRSKGEGFVFPDNPHVLLGLNELVDKIIEENGYMIREFHAVCDIPDGQWFDDGPSENWALNSAAQGQGGWWGGITKNQLREHYEYIQPLIDANKLTVLNPTEAIRYRLTRNAVQEVANISKTGSNYNLEVKINNQIDEKYWDEITVLVSFEESMEKLDVRYNTPHSVWGKTPRRKPRKMDANGRVWSVSVNPFLGAATLVPNADWTGPGVDVGEVSTVNYTATTGNNIRYQGIVNNQLALELPAGNYQVELFNLQGRLIQSAALNSINGVVQTGISTASLTNGMYVLNVRADGGSSLLTQRIVLR